MELTAKVVNILPLVGGTSARGEWHKQSIIVEYGDRYPRILELTNMKNFEEFGRLEMNAEYTFYFDASSREYNGRYFTSCDCYRWEKLGSDNNDTPSPSAPQGAAGPYNPAPQNPSPQQPSGNFNVPHSPVQQPYQNQGYQNQGYPYGSQTNVPF